MALARFALLLVLLLPGCSEDSAPPRQVHTAFTEASGLVVTDSLGLSQQLVAESQAARAVVSPSGRWIAVEDSRLSNLVVVRVFRFDGERYEEVPVPGIREQWEKMAAGSGLSFEDLINPRVGIEGFGPGERTLLLQFHADTGFADPTELSARREIGLESAPAP